MKTVVYQGPYGIEQVPGPKIEVRDDAVVRLTTINICASDLHTYEGRVGTETGMVLGVTRGGGR